MKVLGRTICILTTLLALSMAVWNCMLSLEKKLYYGTIKFKIEATQWSKYSAEADPLFVVNFGKRGIVEVHPTWNDFKSLNIGDKVGYVLHVNYDHDYSGRFILWLFATAVACWVTVVLISYQNFKKKSR